MKNLFKIFFFILVFVNITKADSPLTSTLFDGVYNDIDIVKQAKKKGTINNKIAKFLHSKDNSIDEKAAVICAIGFNINGTDNAEHYSKIIFKKSLSELDIKSIDADDAFCIGYLQALDDYFHPAKAIPYLEAAQQELNTSFTAAVILAIVKAQEIMDNGDWCKMWDITYKVYNDKSLYTDMREGAKKIIKDYMILYKC
ncbi:MAG: hypothetical protein EHM58_18545 [Ignavibacteriae bacterium]|nr:MAG: hypothetical protein EHM58_18545 [Ignavibacteriota bacterium]